MNRPLLSIIIPVFNCEVYIKECIYSIIDYDGDDIEIIIIDDGSTDNSLYEIRSIYDKRIKIFSQINQGPSIARNKGIEYSTGKYILFMDSDDWIEKDSIMKIIKLLKISDVDTLIFNKYVWKSNRRRRIEKLPFNKEFQYDKSNKNILLKVLFTTFLLNSPCGKIYCADIIKLNNIFFPNNIRYGEDAIFNNLYFIYSEKGKYIDDSFYNYRYNENSLTRKFDFKMFEDLVFLYKQRLDLINTYIDIYKDNNKLINKLKDTCITCLTSSIVAAKKNNIENKIITKQLINNKILVDLIIDNYKTNFNIMIKRLLIKYRFYNIIFIVNRIRKYLNLN